MTVNERGKYRPFHLSDTILMTVNKRGKYWPSGEYFWTKVDLSVACGKEIAILPKD